MEKECSQAALLDKLDFSLDRDQDRALFGFHLPALPLVVVWSWIRHAICYMETMKHNGK